MIFRKKKLLQFTNKNVKMLTHYIEKTIIKHF